MSEVDLDLLADHLSGVLDGTPDGSRVAALIASDPRWATAATRMSAAFDAVAADLEQLSTPVMPDDVAARFDQTLRELPGARGARRAGSPVTSPAGSRGPSRPGDSPVSPPARPGRVRSRRFARWGAGLAVAAAAAGFATFGISYLGLPGQDDSESTPEVQTAQSAAPDDGPPPFLLASGVDYHRGTLPAEPPPAPPLLEVLATPVGSGPQPNTVGPQAEGSEPDAAGPPPALAHLLPLPPTCQAAVQSSYDERVRVRAVDYAHFEGAPALVFWLETADGARWVSITGPRCGATAAEVDEQLRVAVE